MLPMRYTILLSAVVLSPVALARAPVFIPDSSCATCEGLDSLPVPYNLSTSQTSSQVAGASNSFWISSFLQGSNGHQYFAISHVLDAESAITYRASVLDITDPSIRVQFSASDTNNGSLFSDTGIFNFTSSNYSFGATSETDGLSQMRTWSNYNGVQFDLTFEMTSPVLLNGGTGSFECRNGTGWEWSMPAGKTTGSLTLEGTTITIDSAHSKTWYDREWGNTPDSWYWFEIHIEPMPRYPNGAVLSVWNWKDDLSGNKNFATVRDGTGTQSVVPVKSFTPIKDSAWTSNTTGGTFVQDFELSLNDGTCLSITSIRDDQQLYNVMDPTAGTGFEGYMTVTGSYKGLSGATGFAVSEQLENSYSMWFE